MRTFLPLVAATFTLSSLASCASPVPVKTANDNPYLAEPPVCDLKAYAAKFGEDSPRTCIAKIVAKRCNRTDSCQFICQISGEWDNVGGGCDHMCNYGEAFDLPAGTEACWTSK